MSCKCTIPCALRMNNPTQTPARKSLNAAGKWAFLPRLTGPQRWSRRLSLCNSTSCSVPVKTLPQTFQPRFRDKKNNKPPSLVVFYPFVVKLFLALEIHENEKQRDEREGESEGRSSQCRWIIGSLRNPVRKDGFETDHSVLHGRIRAPGRIV